MATASIPTTHTDIAHGRTLLWSPPTHGRQAEQLQDFMAWVGQHQGPHLESYRQTWAWSVTDLSDFWDCVRAYFDVLGAGFTAPALTVEQMPGARWYPDARLNYAENVLRHAKNPDRAPTTAIVHLEEDGSTREISWETLASQVASLAASLREMGVQPGDVVAAVLPNIPEAIIGMLASASVGAVWCICSPDLGVKATLDRLRQLDPVVLIGTAGYRFNGKWFDRAAHLDAVEAGLPTVLHTVSVTTENPGARLAFGDLMDEQVPAKYDRGPFEHPLWVLFTSGTTGTPKGIVHSHGGMVLEALKTFGLHFGMRPGDRYYVAANTSWMVWNTVLGNLMTGASVITYAGSPTYPRVDRQFRIIADTRATMMGTGAAYLRLVQKSGYNPARNWDLGSLHTLMSTGSTVPDSTCQWVHEAIGPAVHLSDVSGGTDICSAFLGSNPLEPVRLGRLQGPMLGVAVQVWNEAGEPVLDEVGEMVITRPMPSMPVKFWGDADGSRYHDAYFAQFPGVWTHGDWILQATDGTFEVLGRSDATLNRAGVRLGSAEIYSALQSVPAISDALAVGVELPDGNYYLPLFVVLADGTELTDQLRGNITAAIREQASARHVPDEILAAPALPVTHAGKKIEVPIKRLYSGADPARVDRGALANPDALDWFIDQAAQFRARPRLDSPDAHPDTSR